LNNNLPTTRFVRRHLLRVFLLFSASVLLLTSMTGQSAPYVVEASSTSFGGQIIPQTGACDMAYDTSILTNTAGNLCTSGNTGSKGHFKVFATPNTTVRIVVRPHNNSGNGVVFSPDGVIFSDSTTAIVFVENATTNIDSGASGIVEIYVGGVLTLVSKPYSATTYNFTNEIDFSEIP
jgi:hypothetical protein